MLQVFYLDVTYTGMLQAYVSSVFQVFHTYMLQVFHLDVAYVCNSFQILFKHFRKCFICFKCFICLLLYVASVASGCFKNKSGIAHVALGKNNREPKTKPK
jgi:hypothetical protein